MARKKKAARAENGAGSFRYTESGKVECRITYRDVYGRSRRKSFTGNDEIDCLEKVEKFRKNLDKMNAGINMDSTIAEIIEDRLNKDLEMNLVGEQGYSRNVGTLRILKKQGIGSMPICKVRQTHILIFLSNITHYSNSVIQKVYQQLKLAFSIAYENEIIEKNIMLSRDIKCPKSDKVDKKVTGYTGEEQKRLIDAIEKHRTPYGRNNYRKQLLLELYTGMRMGEINALKPEDIDMENKQIHVCKTISRGMGYRNFIKEGTKTYAGERVIPMSSKAETIIKEALGEMKRNPEGLIFYDYVKKGFVETSQVNCFFKRICEKANVPFNGQHALRHTFATRCIESGIQPIVLKTWMGHTNIHITLDTYADVFDKMNEQSVDQFDKYLDTI